VMEEPLPEYPVEQLVVRAEPYKVPPVAIS